MTHITLSTETAQRLLTALETDVAHGETLIRAEDYPALLGELRAALTTPAHPHTFQARAVAWVREAFGSEAADCRIERAHRFLEEANELGQAAGVTEEEAHQLVTYTYSRPAGEVDQETGGVLLTLAPFTAAYDVDMMAAAEAELTRVNTPEVIERCRRKNASKPRNSPLPGSDTAEQALVGGRA